jgi:hypothetical protein
MIVSIISKKINFTLVVLFCINLLIFSLIVWINNSSDILLTCSTFSKLYSVPIFFIYFSVSIKNNESIYVVKYTKIMTVSILVFIFNILAGLLGFGFPTYNIENGSMGIKGFFYAGNEVSILFFCLYYYLLSQIPYRKIFRLMIYFIAFIVSFMIGTKTVIAACFIFSFIDYYYISSKKGKMLFPVISGIIVLITVYYFQHTNIYKFFEYRFLTTLDRNKSNILDAITSGRLTALGDFYQYWAINFSFLHFMFGIGIHPIKGIEIDFFETFFFFGIITLFFVFCFYLNLIYKSAIKGNKKLLCFNILYFIISFFAGHVWFGVMAGFFYAYINSYELNK